MNLEPCGETFCLHSKVQQHQMTAFVFTTIQPHFLNRHTHTNILYVSLSCIITSNIYGDISFKLFLSSNHWMDMAAISLLLG